MKTYRKSVAAVIVNSEHKIWLGERSYAPKTYGFVQGGIEATDATNEAALRREFREEIGTDDFTILSVLTETLYYDFPKNKQQNYLGQAQQFYLVRLTDLSKINLVTDEPEWLSYSFVSTDEIKNYDLNMERSNYLKALAYFEKEI